MAVTRILIVEDEIELRETLSNLLEMYGYRVMQANNGKEALKKMQKTLPDLIISDVMMPEMDGFQFLKKVRDGKHTELIPFIILSAKVELESRLEGLNFGADDYICKPFEMEELSLKVKNLLAARRKLINTVLSEPKHLKVIPDTEKFLRSLKQVLEERISDKEMDLNYISGKLNISRSTLQKKIKSITGQNISSYVREFRLRRAKQLIESSYGNISQIAEKTGFSSVSYFSLSYKNYFGYPPTKERK